MRDFNVQGVARWQICSGASIPFLNELWLANGERIDRNIPGFQFLENFSVGSLFHPLSKEWNQDVIQHIFLSGVVDSIMQTPLLRYCFMWSVTSRYFIHVVLNDFLDL